jgi:hypothetical protein
MLSNNHCTLVNLRCISTNCRFPSFVADNDSSTCGFGKFSSKWRTHFSHLRGGSYNRAVVQISINPGRVTLVQEPCGTRMSEIR